MLFPTVAPVTSQPMSPTEERARQILVADSSDSGSSNQRRQARGTVSNENLYEGVSKSLIDALSEFLRADPFAKKVTQRLATKESNSDLNIDLRDWTQRRELLYKGSVLYISKVEALWMKILKKHHDDPLAGHLATRKCHIRGYIRRNACSCWETLQNVSLHTLSLRHDCRRISRSHHAKSHTIALSTFSDYI